MTKLKVAVCAAMMTAATLMAGAAAQAQEVVRIATTKAAGAATIFMAEDRGYFADEGIEVKWTYFENQQALAASVISGTDDVTASGIPAGFYNVATQNGLKLIAGLGGEKRGFRSGTFVATPKAFDAGMKTPKDILGGSIAIATKGSAHHFALIQLATKYGVDPDKLHIVTMQGNGNVAAALKNNAVDAAVMSSVPGATAAAENYGKVIGYVGDETEYSGLTFFTRSDVIEEKRHAMVGFLRAVLRAAKDYDAAFQQLGPDGKPVRGSEADAILKLVSDHTDQPVDVVSSAMTYLEPEGRLPTEEIEQQIEAWQALGMVSEGIRAEEVMDLSLLQEALEPATR